MEGSFPAWLKASRDKLVSISVANDSPHSLRERRNCPEQFTDPLLYGHISEGGVGAGQSGISSRVSVSDRLPFGPQSISWGKPHRLLYLKY